jgi:2-keto-3-deoxy-6-phosphogluconate aldolase
VTEQGSSTLSDIQQKMNFGMGIVVFIPGSATTGIRIIIAAVAYSDLLYNQFISVENMRMVTPISMLES